MTLTGLVAVTNAYSYLFFVSVFFTVNATMLNVVVALFVDTFSKYVSCHRFCVLWLAHLTITFGGSQLDFQEPSASLQSTDQPLPCEHSANSILHWKLMRRHRYHKLRQKRQCMCDSPGTPSSSANGEHGSSGDGNGILSVYVPPKQPGSGIGELPPVYDTDAEPAQRLSWRSRDRQQSLSTESTLMTHTVTWMP